MEVVGHLYEVSRSWRREGRAFRGLCIIPHVPSLAMVVRLVGDVLAKELVAVGCRVNSFPPELGELSVESAWRINKQK